MSAVCVYRTAEHALCFTSMVGCFGLDDDPHPSHFPRDRLVEANLRVDIWELHRNGALVDGATTELRWGDHGGPLIF